MCDNKNENNKDRVFLFISSFKIYKIYLFYIFIFIVSCKRDKLKLSVCFFSLENIFEIF
jgi:hypothetical protein